MVPTSVAGHSSRSSARVGKDVPVGPATTSGAASGWAIRWNISETAKRPTIAATTSMPVSSSVRPNVKRSEPVSVSRPMVVRRSPKSPEASPLRKLASARPASRVRAKTARANVSGDPKWRTTSPRGSTSAIRTTMLARPPIVPHTSETPSALAAFPCRVSS